MMRYLLAALLVCAAAQLEPALAAEPYDGTWTGTMSGGGAQCPANVFRMKIADNAVRGVVQGRIPFKGTVAADGTLTGGYNYPEHSVSGTVTAKIAADQFTGQLQSQYENRYSCTRDPGAKRS